MGPKLVISMLHANDTDTKNATFGISCTVEENKVRHK